VRYEPVRSPGKLEVVGARLGVGHNLNRQGRRLDARVFLVDGEGLIVRGGDRHFVVTNTSYEIAETPSFTGFSHASRESTTIHPEGRRQEKHRFPMGLADPLFVVPDGVEGQTGPSRKLLLGEVGT